MPSIGFPELIIVLVIALIIFGPGKLPAVGSAIGKSIKEFKKASKEVLEEVDTTTLKVEKEENKRV